jgi:DNA mismatch repair protein MutS
MSAAPPSATPAMRQWFAAKAAHPEALVFYRMGDFYELFFDDAKAASAALDIALTYRGEHAGEKIPMCGVPAAAAESYLARLIRRGFRVAVADQVETPAEARARGGAGAPIRREVVRLVTPGTLTEESLLEGGRANWLAAVAGAPRGGLGLAWLDLSTGAVGAAATDADQVGGLVAQLAPSELLHPEALETVLAGPIAELGPRATKLPAQAFEPRAAARHMAETYGVASADAFGEFTEAEVTALGVVLAYARRTQAGKLPALARPSRELADHTMAIDAATRRSLEITEGTASLRAAVDRTRTAGGARLLAARLAAPSTDLATIRARHDQVAAFLEDPPLRHRVREMLRGSADLARALARLALGRGSPRDLGAIRDGLGAAEALAEMLTGPTVPARIAWPAAALLPRLLDQLRWALAGSLPISLAQGGFVAPGHDAQLDDALRLRDDSRKIVALLEAQYRSASGANAKLRHTTQIGYFLEVPAAVGEAWLRQKPEKLPPLTHRATMAGTMRFTTPEIADLDRRIAEAAETVAARERAVFEALASACVQAAQELAQVAAQLAETDLAASLADLAEAEAWCRPRMTDDASFAIEAGRHPAVERARRQAGEAGFVANGCDLSPGRRMMLLTGPNMAGKSTYLRQNALIAVLAQAGAFVPAKSATIGVVDRLFSRVGAADDLSRGRSTFMVEMVETAAILNQAGPRSFVILDELGRGTATWDGLALAWAVTEALHDRNRARVIFATHFHELGALAGRLPELTPSSMRVKEFDGRVVFLHEVGPGGAAASYGIHVARLAGVPEAVVTRARTVLAALEARARGLSPLAEEMPLFAAMAPQPTAPAAPDALPNALLALLDATDPDSLTPRDAHALVCRLKALRGSA